MVVGGGPGLGEVESDPGHREHPTAGDASVRVDTGVEAQRGGAIGPDRTARHLVGDRGARHRSTRVAGCCGHDGDGGLRANDHRELVQLALRGEQGQFGDVGLDEREHGLRLGVAEAHVVLDQARSVGGQHQPGEDHADVRGARRGEVVEDGLDELGDQVVGVVGHRCRRVGAHAAGVRPGVALAETLVVLGEWERDRSYAVAQRQQRALGAGQALFEQEPTAGGTDGLDRGGLAVRHGDALPGGETVELDHDRSVEFAPPGDRRVVVVEAKRTVGRECRARWRARVRTSSTTRAGRVRRSVRSTGFHDVRTRRRRRRRVRPRGRGTPGRCRRAMHRRDPARAGRRGRGAGMPRRSPVRARPRRSPAPASALRPVFSGRVRKDRVGHARTPSKASLAWASPTWIGYLPV